MWREGPSFPHSSIPSLSRILSYFCVMGKTFYRGDLPHYLPNDRPYFLTFRLAGSEPRDEELLQLLLLKQQFLEYDRMLDLLRSGPHHLRNPRIADLVAEAIHYRDGKDYELHAFTIMSNHVHMVVTLAERKVLYDVLRELKSWTAKESNTVLGLHGDFWLHEGYDHVVRKGRFGYAIMYVLNNPVKAGIVNHWRDHRWTYLNPNLPGFE